MFWENYSIARTMFEKGDARGALNFIACNRDLLKELPSTVGCLEAQCYDSLGDVRSAYHTLHRLAELRSEDPWVYYGLGNFSWKVGKYEENKISYQRYHELLGWPQSRSNDYIFTHDFFAPNIPVWTQWFSQYINQSPIVCLEVGSWQGGSASWLLDNIIAKRPGSQITCVDPFEGSSEHAAYIDRMRIEDLFDSNIRKTGHENLCLKIKGYSQDVLVGLSGSYDFIYLDGAHEAKFVIQDAILAWRLLKIGGFLLFDDYPFRFAESPEQDTATAIDGFMTWYKAELKVIEKDRQVLLQKLESSGTK